jgi:DNA-binding CsgD family transcriptional regulator
VTSNSTSTAELAVTGIPSSGGWLLRHIAAAPAAPCTAAIVGPGGTGKSALLDALVREYQKAGTAVLRGDSASLRPEPLDPSQPVVVDDAHQLAPAVLGVLQTLAEQDTARLFVAYRPWPRSAELSALGATLVRRRSPVVVGHLDRAAVAAHIAARLGCLPPESLVELVHEQTGGLPWLVDLVIQALGDTGRFDPQHPEQFRRPERVTVSVSLAERLRYHLEELDPEVYRLVQAMAVGAALDAEALAPLLDTDPAALTATVQAALATGLLTEAGELIVFIRNLVLQLMPLLHSRVLRQRLATIQLDRGGSALAAGRQLLGTGASGRRVADALERAGDEALRRSPALAAELFAGALQAGMSLRALAARHAQAAALAGDIDQALRLADQIVSDPDAPDRERGIRVSAALLAHRGLAAGSAELYASLPADAAGGAALAVPALVGIGALAQAQEVLEAVLEAGATGIGWGAGLLAGAEILMARGVLATVTGTAAAALSQLARAALLLEPAGETVLLPDTPAALTAVVAMHCGELMIADSTLRRAVAAKLGGRPAHPRHLLLHGWVALANGRLDTAHRALERAAHYSDPLEPRDELLAATLEIGLARREDDPAALGRMWRRAQCAVLRYPIDLYMLKSLGELVIAAARLGEREWVASHVKDAEELLEALGNPVLWAAPLRWSQLQAAIVAGEPSEARRHHAALAGAAPSHPYVAALAAAAGSWLAITGGIDPGGIDPEAVRAAAQGLHRAGLTWDAVQLAGQAATRTTDRRAMAMLLSCARSLHGSRTSGPAGPVAMQGPGAATDPAPAPPERPASRADAGGEPAPVEMVLSERELEVGQLILAGLTHKQIGERLFISTKTVEYHMAKIRQRLGVENRNELFGRLRSLIEAMTSTTA